MTTITAHGKTYSSRAAAEARLAELAKLDAELGASDGRVTEALLIREALAALPAEKTPEEIEAARREADYRRHAADQVLAAERELRNLSPEERESAGFDIHRLHYYDEKTGRETIARYKSEPGFLRALIRVYGDPARYSVINAD